MRELLSLSLIACVISAASACVGGVELSPSVDQLEHPGSAQPRLEAQGLAEPEAPREPALDEPRPAAPNTLDRARAPEEERASSRRDARPQELEPEPEPEPVEARTTQGCQELDAEDAFGCYSSSECCEGFCTYCGTSYMPGHCQLPLELGAPCLGAEWCQSGVCVDGVCHAEPCAGVSGACWSSSACCQGFFCADGEGSAPGTCTKALDDGEACVYHDWCASKSCIEGVCTSESCAPNATPCYSGDACCTGLCTWDQQNPYLPGECFSPQPPGASCLEDAWCESGVCTDGSCEALDCEPLEAMCWDDSACCQGFCTYSGESAYTPGVCQPLQALEAACEADTWCASGSCIDGLCKPSGCQPLAGECHAGSDCCSGLCTYSGQGELCGTCIDEQAEGMPCVADMWCISKSCVDGLCASGP